MGSKIGGEMVTETYESIEILTHVTDLDYLRMQRLSIQVKDFGEQLVYGHCLFSLYELCNVAFSSQLSYNSVLLHNGRKGGRFKALVSLHRVGDPTPASEVVKLEAAKSSNPEAKGMIGTMIRKKQEAAFGNKGGMLALPE